MKIRLDGHIAPPPLPSQLHWLFESRVVIILWACCPISFGHKHLLYLFLEPHQTQYHWNKSVWLEEVIALNVSTFQQPKGASGKHNKWSQHCLSPRAMDKIFEWICLESKLQMWIWPPVSPNWCPHVLLTLIKHYKWCFVDL